MEFKRIADAVGMQIPDATELDRQPEQLGKRLCEGRDGDFSGGETVTLAIPGCM